jgi:hypothetical protein
MSSQNIPRKNRKRDGINSAHTVKRVLFDIIYFTLVIPFAIGIRLFGDPLKIKAISSKQLWLDRALPELEIEQARRQF